MNRPRDPLGYSLHDILGMIATSHGPGRPGDRPCPGADLTVEVFGEIRQTAAALAAAWRPAAQGRSFVWRGVTEQGSLDARLYQAASALEALTGMTRLNETLAEVTGLTRPSDAGALAGLLSHLLAWPPGMPDEWLTAGTLDPAEASVAQVAAALSEIAACEDQAARAAGVPWSAIPQIGMLPAVDGAALAGLAPPCADPGGLTAEQITGLSRAFAADADMLEERLGSLSGLASMLGLRAPVTFSDAADLLAIADLAEEPDRPERGWLSIPGNQAASEAGRALYDAHRRSPGRKPTPAPTTPPRCSSTMCRAWPAGLTANITAWASCPRSTGRTRDRRRLHPGRDRQGNRLPASPARRRLEERRAGARRRRGRFAPLLGRYYAGAATDFDRLGRALTTPPTPCTGPTGRISGRPPATSRRCAAEPGDHRHRGRGAPGPGRLAGDPGPAAHHRRPPGAAERHDRRGGRVAAGPSRAAARGRRVHPQGQRGRGQAADLRPGPAPGRPAGGGRRRARAAGRPGRGVPRRMR